MLLCFSLGLETLFLLSLHLSKSWTCYFFENFQSRSYPIILVLEITKNVPPFRQALVHRNAAQLNASSNSPNHLFIFYYWTKLQCKFLSKPTLVHYLKWDEYFHSTGWKSKNKFFHSVRFMFFQLIQH